MTSPEPIEVEASSGRHPGHRTTSRWAFSVRGLMVLVLLIGGALGWVLHRARVQREAVAAIEKAGGRVYYEWQMGLVEPVILDPRPRNLQWMRASIGREFFDDVTYVVFIGPRNPDAAMSHIGRLRQIKGLMFDGSAVSDAGMSNLATLTHLEYLSLGNTKIGDAGLAHLSGLTRLRWLGLAGTRTTDAGLAHLTGLRRLESLDLYQTQVTDHGMEVIQSALPRAKMMGP